MPILILGLAIFLGAHSLRIFAESWRTQTIARIGEKRWKAIYSLISVIGFVLIVWGFGRARANPVLLYATPLWLAHLNALWTLIAFVLLASSHAPPTHWKAWLHHPMAAGVRSKTFSTAASIFSSATTPVPKVSTMMETGLATPMA